MQYKLFKAYPLYRLKAFDGLVMDWGSPGYDNPVYQWHFITQAAFHEGRDVWTAWNRSFAPALVTNQTVETAQDGKSFGFWVSPGRQERYGRVYSTALCCMMLENYYVYLPFYRPVEVGVQEPEAIPADVNVEIRE